MNISYNWLKQYIDLDLSPAETEEKLTLSGLEVEGIEQIGSDFEGFVVGEINQVRSHPNADKLQICDVNLGNKEVQIICGAKNVAKGQKVPVATVGSTLPVPMDDGSYLKIKKAKLRGEASHGMICSESELGLSDDHSGIMVLNSDLQVGSSLKEALNVDKDTIFEIGLTPNRPDASCHVGVARDLSAITGKPLNNPYSELKPEKGSLDDHISISIRDEDKCHRYVGIMVRDLEVKESPAWLKQKLTAIGLRPRNNVVDITNYVLQEIGQPLHAFDYDKIASKKIEVKTFDKEMNFTTLDDVERKVPAGSLFICDGNGPVAIAGVMGGENSEVSLETKNVLIESAYFNPSSIRKTSKQLALQTDSSYRFERGIDPEIQLKAAQRAAELIRKYAGGEIVKGFTDVHPVKFEKREVSLRLSRINRVLGTSLTLKKAEEILNGLEFETTLTGEGQLLCKVPTFRPDVTREIDLIEEVGRIFDYNNIPSPTSSPFFTPETLSDFEVYQQKIKYFAKGLGYKEISTNSLLSPKEAEALAEKELQVETLNPVSQENTTLRTHLAGGFLKSVGYNLNRNAEKIRFFELGHVFRNANKENSTWVGGIQENVHLLMGSCGQKYSDDWQGSSSNYSIFDVKADLEALIQHLDIDKSVECSAENNYSLQYSLNGKTVAELKQIDEKTLHSFDVEKDAFVAEINISLLYEMGAGRDKTTYKPVAKYPSFEFDAAFTVDKSIRAGELSSAIHKNADETLQSVSAFDVYEGANIGEDKKSIAFRLTFLDPNKTLTIKDVEPRVQKIVQSLEKKFGAKLRS
ncbi:phenylalanine--tRNA ligase subunit beta [Rhodohalobacter barkolensis]|uniref:Phenylalanine--tRNA ligase beta subunit n=1 Tax=Rhodohalobacter barkolensis TaxID=2053187 RepID=A0A2N0VK46_9BACT|nr:phenylalanine--tRNA ligase subunit beta [Rhodohalobacter barkolensis]PKD44565.1 phenylalanine--tRNA ligase subunit beta [Rhodohalobacter barkolensis]